MPEHLDLRADIDWKLYLSCFERSFLTIPEKFFTKSGTMPEKELEITPFCDIFKL